MPVPVSTLEHSSKDISRSDQETSFLDSGQGRDSLWQHLQSINGSNFYLSVEQHGATCETLDRPLHPLTRNPSRRYHWLGVLGAKRHNTTTTTVKLGLSISRLSFTSCLYSTSKNYPACSYTPSWRLPRSSPHLWKSGRSTSRMIDTIKSSR